MALAIHATGGIDNEDIRARRGFAQHAETRATRPVAPGVFVFFGVGLSANDRAELDHPERVIPVAAMLFVAPTDVDRLPYVDALSVEHERV